MKGAKVLFRLRKCIPSRMVGRNDANPALSRGVRGASARLRGSSFHPAITPGPANPRPSRRGDQRDEGEQVTQRDPLDITGRGAEICLNRWQSQRDDIGVDLTHERTRTHGGDHAPMRVRRRANPGCSGALANGSLPQAPVLLRAVVTHRTWF